MTLHFTPEEAEHYEKSLREVHFQSNFGWVNSHNGFRRGNMHLLIAGTGAGKSTLTRSIIKDLVFHRDNNCAVGLWLSEESVQEYRTLFSLGAESDERLYSTNAFSEQDHPEARELVFFEWLEAFAPDVLIMDNITTSKFYADKKNDEQARFAIKLKNILKKLNCAGIIIAHADSSQTNQKGGLLDINNIRGSRTICNLAEFAYLVQTFETTNLRYTTIRIAKSRSQNIIHDLYFLKYDKSKMAYIGDSAEDFKRFQEVFSARNRL